MPKEENEEENDENNDDDEEEEKENDENDEGEEEEENDENDDGKEEEENDENDDEAILDNGQLEVKVSQSSTTTSNKILEFFKTFRRQLRTDMMKALDVIDAYLRQINDDQDKQHPGKTWKVTYGRARVLTMAALKKEGLIDIRIEEVCAPENWENDKTGKEIATKIIKDINKILLVFDYKRPWGRSITSQLLIPWVEDHREEFSLPHLKKTVAAAFKRWERAQRGTDRNSKKKKKLTKKKKYLKGEKNKDEQVITEPQNINSPIDNLQNDLQESYKPKETEQNENNEEKIQKKLTLTAKAALETALKKNRWKAVGKIIELFSDRSTPEDKLGMSKYSWTSLQSTIKVRYVDLARKVDKQINELFNS